MRHDLIAVIDSQDVAVAQVQAGGRGREKRRGLVKHSYGHSTSLGFILSGRHARRQVPG